MSEEPVFVRSRWGTSRYVYNHRNPVGLALIILTPLFAIGMLFALQAETRWSEGELEDAVREGVERLNGGRHYTPLAGDHGFLIAEAMYETGVGPKHGVDTDEGRTGGTPSARRTPNRSTASASP
ncbi:hypothetical protein RGF97_01490 [Streptomyces roseicoloratus]|uniref:Uncharacterized protein n=1 Tax=Streptomyces roseicoloratus TaxID=2508722 RepID=A0ABY9RQ48_9ACTN|nr:hypothetical protein [Streptomyces roseicoloratus]WMX43804.1 hypothetical protein RGF97_01490 [Streptomyces roseicoloratus]